MNKLFTLLSLLSLILNLNCGGSSTRKLTDTIPPCGPGTIEEDGVCVAKDELCDGEDNDGDGLTDEGCPDWDEINITVNTPTEECNGQDDNNNGTVDEGCRIGDAVLCHSNGDCVNALWGPYCVYSVLLDVSFCQACLQDVPGQQYSVNGVSPGCSGNLPVCAWGGTEVPVTDFTPDGMVSFYWCVECNGPTDCPEDHLCIDQECVSQIVDADDDGFPSDVDCDDHNYDIHPGAYEVCDGLDNDCDAVTDEGCPVPDYDEDNDGYSPLDGDCDDNNFNVNPMAVEECNGIDDDCDGETDESNPYMDIWCFTLQEIEGNTVPVRGHYQCKEGTISCIPQPLATCRELFNESCGNGVDDNCNGQVDEDCGDDPVDWCNGIDDDGDGSIDEDDPNIGHLCTTILHVNDNDVPVQGTYACGEGGIVCAPPALEECQLQTEICGDIFDNNCNGQVNEGCGVPCGDELCFDGIDNDCDGLTDEELLGDVVDEEGCIPTFPCYLDQDGDTWGTWTDQIWATDGCPEGYVAVKASDCDDSDPNVYPSADELCDGEDNDCDSLIDEDCECQSDDDCVASGSCYCDQSGDYICTGTSGACVDGVCETTENIMECDLGCYQNGCITDEDEDGFTTPQDCDDEDPEVHPGAQELCDEKDNDCDGQTDEAYADSLGQECFGWLEDGHCTESGIIVCSEPGELAQLSCTVADPPTLYTTADYPAEFCDGLDNNCDGQIDEGCVQTASLTIDLAATPAAGSVYTAGSQDVAAAGFTFTASSISDIVVNSIKLTGYLDVTLPFDFSDADDKNQLSGFEEVIVAVTLYDEYSMAALADTKQFTVNPSDITVEFDQLNWGIEKGDTANLLVTVEAAGSAPLDSDDDAFAIAIANPEDVNGTDSTFGVDVPVILNNGNTEPAIYQVVTESGMLDMAIHPDTPASSLLAAGSTDNLVTQVEFTAAVEAFIVQKLKVRQILLGGDDAVNSVSVSCVNSAGEDEIWDVILDISGEAVLNSLDCYVPEDGSAVVGILASANTIAGGADNDDAVQFEVDADENYQAIGLNSGVVKTENDLGPDANATGETHYVFDSFPMINFSADTPTGNFVPSVNTLVGRLTISAIGSSDLTFENSAGNQLEIEVSVVGGNADGGDELVIKDSGGNTLCTDTLDLPASGSVTAICDFAAKDLFIAEGTAEHLDIYMNTLDLLDAGDSVQLWLSESSALDWGVDSSGNYGHADIILKGDLFGGAMVKP